MRAFLFILLTTFIFNLFLGWWAVLIPSILLGAWLIEKGEHAFLIGFFAGGFAWFCQALFIHIANDGILSTRITEMVQAGSPWLVLAITFLVGGLLGGSGSLFGFQFKKAMRPEASPTT